MAFKGVCPLLVVLGSYLPSSAKKNVVKVGSLQTKFSGSARDMRC